MPLERELKTINIGNDPTSTISKNKIYNLAGSGSNAITGIDYTGNASSISDSIEKNMITLRPATTGIFTKINYSGDASNSVDPETAIKFALAKVAKVDLTIYNIKGEVVKSLANNNYKAGYYSVNFNATGLNSGVYIYKLTTPEQSFVKKMIMVK